MPKCEGNTENKKIDVLYAKKKIVVLYGGGHLINPHRKETQRIGVSALSSSNSSSSRNT